MRRPTYKQEYPKLILFYKCGEDLYPSLLEKAVALGFSIIMNRQFVDGNKRTGHAVTETFLVLNGIEVNASVDE